MNRADYESLGAFRRALARNLVRRAGAPGVGTPSLRAPRAPRRKARRRSRDRRSPRFRPTD